jgi:WD40 repeat protein
VTSATKSISIWDQETLKLVADFSNLSYIQGFVKAVVAIPQYCYLAAACERNVLVWDVRTYEPVVILKAHKDEVRSLYSVGNLFFSAGKGGQNFGGLLVWDLRMLESPLDEKEKNVDTFTMVPQ